MMSLRKWLLAAMTALALAAPLMVAPPAQANGTMNSRANPRVYSVYARDDPNSPWYLIASYYNYNDAQTAAAFLQDLGYDAFVR